LQAPISSHTHHERGLALERAENRAGPALSVVQGLLTAALQRPTVDKRDETARRIQTDQKKKSTFRRSGFCEVLRGKHA